MVDPRRISTDLGGEEAFRALAGAARDAGLGIVLDVVPNHMATSDENPFWSDPALRARYFDIDPGTGRHRRFFSIDELAGVRVEDPEVFEVTQSLAIGLVNEGLVDGLRIDHPDGLADPGELPRPAGRARRRAHLGGEDPPAGRGPARLAGRGDHRLRVHGRRHRAVHRPRRRGAAGRAAPPPDRASGAPSPSWPSEAMRDEAHTTFEPEVARLQDLVDEPDMADAVAALPVYRTYIAPEADEAQDQDLEVVEEAGLPERVRDALVDPADESEAAFAVRFQQTTGAIMAKGVEDTALYRYTRLLALNEVGSDPGTWGRTPDEVHAANRARAERFPRALLATQTHDTKRSGDVRARIGALSWIPGEWAAAVGRWWAMNAAHRTGGAPTPDEEYLVYQTLVGAWPLGAERLREYVVKALREAGTTTGWVDPDEAHEAAVLAFCDALEGSTAVRRRPRAPSSRASPPSARRRPWARRCSS